MILQWFNARQASEAGAALADKLTPSAARIEASGSAQGDGAVVQDIVKRARTELNDQRFNFYQRAKLANAFKWRLIENGIERKIANRVTQSLVIDLSSPQGASPGAGAEREAKPPRTQDVDADKLLAKGKKLFEQGDYAAALKTYEQLLKANPRQPEALNNVGSIQFQLGNFIEAEKCFRGAITLRPDYPEALSNLGNVLRRRGYLTESESSLRRAIKLKPNYLDAHCDLGLTLALAGDTHGAKGRFRKVLKAKPHHVDALLGMAQAEAMEGDLQEASKLLERVLEANPKNISALAAQTSLRKMSGSDAHWLEIAETAASSGIPYYEEATLRYAIGKYHDDLGDFARAFESFRRANEIFKTAAEPYDRKARTRLAQDLMSAYSRDALAQPQPGGAPTATPVFIVGMPRSGTSLADQIVCSHPAVRGAGESEFWYNAVHDKEGHVRHGRLDEQRRKTLADAYLRTLEERAGKEPSRIVDKAPANADFLGVIRSVLPNARFIYMRRNPIDSCLSSYFQAFPLTANFTFDLSDLAHYYKEHQRLIAHWRAALAPGSLLEVPYAELVADQEGWTRRMLEFIGVDWEAVCLNFQDTQRVVPTASYWQVRQKMYTSSIDRWRNYEKFIGPLLDLKEG
jgi:tetratricopeptide (TPR) repeat protein